MKKLIKKIHEVLYGVPATGPHIESLAKGIHSVQPTERWDMNRCFEYYNNELNKH